MCPREGKKGKETLCIGTVDTLLAHPHIFSYTQRERERERERESEKEIARAERMIPLIPPTVLLVTFFCFLSISSPLQYYKWYGF